MFLQFLLYSNVTQAYIYIHSFSHIIFHPDLSQEIGCSPQQDRIANTFLNGILCLHQPQTPSPSHSLPLGKPKSIFQVHESVSVLQIGSLCSASFGLSLTCANWGQVATRQSMDLHFNSVSFTLLCVSPVPAQHKREPRTSVESYRELGDPFLQFASLWDSSHTFWLSGAFSFVSLARKLRFGPEFQFIHAASAMQICNWDPPFRAKVQEKKRPQEIFFLYTFWPTGPLSPDSFPPKDEFSLKVLVFLSMPLHSPTPEDCPQSNTVKGKRKEQKMSPPYASLLPVLTPFLNSSCFPFLLSPQYFAQFFQLS